MGRFFDDAPASQIARAAMLAATLGALFYARYIAVHRIEFDFTICTFRRVLHLPCPFCFMTRSWRLMAAGDLHEAFFISPLGGLLFWGAALAALWLLAALIFRLPALPIVRWSSKKPVWIGALVVVLANWAYNFRHLRWCQ